MPYQFGPFQLDEENQVLAQKERFKRISGKAFQVLLLLVQCAGDLVRKDTFLGRIWGTGESHPGIDNDLAHCVLELRKALGDRTDNPLYIKTEPTLGYRFIARVKKVRRARHQERPTASQSESAQQDRNQLRGHASEGPRVAAVETGVFSEPLLCFQLLTPPLQDLFCQLTIFPNSFDAAGAAAVWEMKLEEAARDALIQLQSFGLVDCTSGARRYQVRDPSVQKFAFGRLTKAQRELAQRRHAEHYRGVIATSQRLYLAGGDNVKRGLDLFRLEWENIKLGQQWAAHRAKFDTAAARLCSDYRLNAEYCLEVCQPPSVRISWGEAALAASLKLKDCVAECSHHETLGLAYAELGDRRTARKHHLTERALARKIGDRRMEGYAQNGLGFDAADEGKSKEAIGFYEEALAIFDKINDRMGKTYALGNLATEYIKLKKPDLALDCQKKSYDISCANGYRRSEAEDLGGFGEAYTALGKPLQALEYHAQALAIDRDLGDRSTESSDLRGEGDAYVALGEFGSAIESYEKAFRIVREWGYRDLEGEYLWKLAKALHANGDSLKAIGRAKAALDILKKLKHPEAANIQKQLAIWRRRK